MSSETFPVLAAFRTGDLPQMLQDKASAFLVQFPQWNEAAALGMAAVYYGNLAQRENEALTMDARRASPETDDLYYWLTEDAPCFILGYLGQFNRSLLFDMQEYDGLMKELEALDWSEQGREKRLLAPARAAIAEYHEDLLR